MSHTACRSRTSRQSCCVNRNADRQSLFRLRTRNLARAPPPAFLFLPINHFVKEQGKAASRRFACESLRFLQSFQH